MLTPEQEARIAELARLTVKTGTDPVLVLAAIQAAAQWRVLTPRQRYVLLRKLRRLRDESVRNAHARQLR